MTFHLYDYRATPLVNLAADQAIALRNRLLQEDPGYRIDLRKACLWGAQSVAPLAGDAEHRQIAYEASVVIQHALALDRMVAAVREKAA